MQRRSINQEGRNNVWKTLGEQMDEVLGNVHSRRKRKKSAFKGRGEATEWRIVQRVKKYQPRKWCEEDCLTRIYTCFMGYNLLHEGERKG